MHAIRSALRASKGRPPARFIRGRRYPSSPRFRSFHISRTLAQASNPPTAPDSTPIGQNDASKPDRDKAAAEEQPAPAVAPDDPEVLAQKLQRSREASRRYSAALRRQQRGKKSSGLPPVHIPDWFLKKRVIRPEDLPAEFRGAAGRAAVTVSVSHAESNQEATCALPVNDSNVARVVSRLVRGMWGKFMDDEERSKVHKYLDERNVAKTVELPDPMAEMKDFSAAAEANLAAETAKVFNDPRFDHLSDPDKHKVATMYHQLRKIANDPNLGSKAKRLAMHAIKRKIEDSRKPGDSQRSRGVDDSTHLSSLLLAEIRAAAAASLSTLHPSGGDAFASIKTNLILHSPVPQHEKLIDAYIHRMAAELGSDLIVLNALDLAQLAGDYLGEPPEPTPRSIRSLGYETYRLSADLSEALDEPPELVEEEIEFPRLPSMDHMQPGIPKFRTFVAPMLALAPLRALMQQHGRSTQPHGQSQFEFLANEASNDNGRTQSQTELQLEDLKLATLLEALVDASEVKQSRGLLGVDGIPALPAPLAHSTSAHKAPAFFDYSVNPDSSSLKLNSVLPATVAHGIDFDIKVGPFDSNSDPDSKSKIVYVKDFKELNATHYGGRIIQKLEELVRKRRLSGESIMIVGSTCSREFTPALSASAVRGLQSDGESSSFRTIVMHAESPGDFSTFDHLGDPPRRENLPPDPPAALKSKYRRINFSHIREMLRSLDPAATAEMTDMEQGTSAFSTWLSIFPQSYHKRPLTYDEVHRISLTAYGLYLSQPVNQAAKSRPNPAQMSWAHVGLAIGLLQTSDLVKYASFDRAGDEQRKPRRKRMYTKLDDEPRDLDVTQDMQRQRDLDRISKDSTKYEKRLISGIADPDQIKTTFDQVHVPEETVDSIRTITSLALLRPDAFSYGILATEKISGALLYGPPGTGKTLLARAVAKESGSTVLEVSGSQIMDKYVGEGEKNVAAIFSLARRLSPCIVFLDEADAVFASRDSRERTSHRDILNQFLKEWDGLSNSSVFVMVATNRPFDLDDAVIRRLPRRLLVDLPTQADRKEILRIHLRDEQLHESVDLDDLAKRTPFYSGSDLKNVAVAAALACVKEENDRFALTTASSTNQQGAQTPSPPQNPTTASSSPQTTPSTDAPKPKSKLRPIARDPGNTKSFEKRTLRKDHFDQALHEIAASISEDMSSLNAIKKFDEQYGDRKGKRTKKGFGFGILAERNEDAARVRM